jgi:hypothetical protein
MAYQTGSATDMADLLSKMLTFATANGWTQDEFNTVAGRFAMHKNTIYASGRWLVATPLHLSLHQALGYTGGNEPGAHPNDSGNGFNTSTSHANASLLGERCVANMGNGPYPSYHFFENDASPAYLHIVVEISTGIFRHFGFGEINKIGTWTGGEYVYGHWHDSTVTNPLGVTDSMLLDGLFADLGAATLRPSTLHCEGLPGQGGTSKWGVILGSRTTTISADTAGVARLDIQGGFRGGPIARHFGYFNAGTTSGLMPWYPIALFYMNRTTSFAYALGDMPDVRGMNIRYFTAGQELVIGLDTWIVFPLQQKTATAGAERTYNSGIAYKKVTA